MSTEKNAATVRNTNLERRKQFTKRMIKLNPGLLDNLGAMYALSISAKYFGLYSKKTVTGDVANYLFGRYVDLLSVENYNESSRSFTKRG